MLFIRLCYHLSCSATSTLNFLDLSESSVFLLLLALHSHWTHCSNCQSFLSLFFQKLVSVVIHFKRYSTTYEFLSSDTFTIFASLSPKKGSFQSPFSILSLRKVECCQKVVGSSGNTGGAERLSQGPKGKEQ